jgi:drug/metabolite transporter (DMT)-like permease
MRLALGALTLLPFLCVGRRSIPREPRLWGQLIIAALLANAIPYSLFAFAERQVPSSAAGILTATTPMWTTVIAYAAGTQRRVPATSIAGLAAGLLGTALLVSPWQAAGTIASIGGLTVLAAAASYGASYVYMNHYLAHRQLDPLVLAASQLIAATGLLTVAVPFAGLQPLHPHLDAVLALIALGVFGTGLAYVVNYRLIASTGTTASVVTYLLPIVAIALGATLHREHTTLHALVGTAIILCAVALIRRTARIPRHRTSPWAARDAVAAVVLERTSGVRNDDRDADAQGCSGCGSQTLRGLATAGQAGSRVVQ